jgi:general stress protein 26
MRPDDPEVLDVVRHSMVARIATLSGHGRPSINPLYFVRVDGNIWLGTADWTLAARNVASNPTVSVLFNLERNRNDARVVRMHGRARVRTDARTQRTYVRHVARKYVLTPSGIRNLTTHARQLPLRRRYYAQSAEKGCACVIDLTPDQVEILRAEPPPNRRR